MAKYRCSVCGYIHDESKEGDRFDGLPSDWKCPVCGAAKSAFELIEQDEEEETPSSSKATPTWGRATLTHRVFGYLFLTIFVILAIQMAPRLWNYQIEFPARTVVHIVLGMAIGVVLVLKIAVVRFFPRLDPTLTTRLGTFLLVGSVVLIGITIPTAFREALATGTVLTPENRERVRILLAETGMDQKSCEQLTTRESLRAGRHVLHHKCIECHDLRTVLAKPRTPENWRQTVARMANRTTVVDPMEPSEQLQVTAYLVAISPNLQKSARQLRQQQDRREQAKQAAASITGKDITSGDYQPAQAERLFEKKCSQCHGTDLVTMSPPTSKQEARQLVTRMVAEGLQATQAELAQIVAYLTHTFAKKSE